MTLAPTTFYAGEATDLVTVSEPGGDLQPLLSGVDFAEGSRYLVSATDGRVTLCGFSGPYCESSPTSTSGPSRDESCRAPAGRRRRLADGSAQGARARSRRHALAGALRRGPARGGLRRGRRRPRRSRRRGPHPGAFARQGRRRRRLGRRHGGLAALRPARARHRGRRARGRDPGRSPRRHGRRRTPRVLETATGPRSLARASYDDAPGHPVVLGRAHWARSPTTSRATRARRPTCDSTAARSSSAGTSRPEPTRTPHRATRRPESASPGMMAAWVGGRNGSCRAWSTARSRAARSVSCGPRPAPG